MDTDCPICLEPFSAPIFILNCGHNLCGECVENLKNQDEDDDEWPCPICRAMQDKSRDLPRNFFAEQVKFSILWQVQKKNSGNGPCKKCSFWKIRITANYWDWKRISENKVILTIYYSSSLWPKFSEKLTEAKEKVKADNDRVKPIEEQFRNILRKVLQLMANDGR